MDRYTIIIYLKLIMLGIAIGMIIGKIYAIKNIEIFSINEGYENQVVLKLNKSYYEYNYNFVERWN